MNYKRLKYLRQMFGITQNEMAKKLDVSQSKYSKFEGNRLKFTGYQSSVILEIFRVYRNKEVQELNEEIKFLNDVV